MLVLRSLCSAFSAACLLVSLAETRAATSIQPLLFFPAGVSPSSALIYGRDGNFYCSISADNKHPAGQVARISPSGQFKIIFEFEDGDVSTTGSEGKIRFVGNDGALYGVTQAGGTFGNGTIFKLTTEGQFTLLHSFTFDASGPYTITEAPSGDIYCGMEGEGSGGKGAIAKLAADGSFSILHRGGLVSTPAPPDPFYLPLGGFESIAIGSDGALYVNCKSGGHATWVWYTEPRRPSSQYWRLTTSPSGGRLRIDMETDEVTEILNTADESYFPYLYPIIANDMIYGITPSAVYGVNTEGEVTTILTLNWPMHMVKGSDGNVYIETMRGGSSNDGEILQHDPNGQTISVFEYPDGYSGDNRTGICEGNDGYIYEIVAGVNTSNKQTSNNTSEPAMNRDFSTTRARGPRIGVVKFKLASLTKSNIPPMARKDIVSMSALKKDAAPNASYSMTVNVLANDKDFEKGPLTLKSAGPAEFGKVTITGGKVTYRTDIPRADHFTYTIADKDGAESSATVLIQPDLSGSYSGKLLNQDGSESGTISIVLPTKKNGKKLGSLSVNGATWKFKPNLDADGRIINIVEKDKDGHPVTLEFTPVYTEEGVHFEGHVNIAYAVYPTTLEPEP